MKYDAIHHWHPTTHTLTQCFGVVETESATSVPYLLIYLSISFTLHSNIDVRCSDVHATGCKLKRGECLVVVPVRWAGQIDEEANRKSECQNVTSGV